MTSRVRDSWERCNRAHSPDAPARVSVQSGLEIRSRLLGSPSLAIRVSFRSAFDDADRFHPRDLLGQAGLMDHIDDEVDIFVGGRLLFGESLPILSASDDASAEQFIVDPPALSECDRFRAAHDSARSAAGCA